MLIKSQNGPGPIQIVNSDHVSAWEIAGNGVLHAYLDNGECFNMGKFGDTDGALKFLSRMQSKIMAGASGMTVPDLEGNDDEN